MRLQEQWMRINRRSTGGDEASPNQHCEHDVAATDVNQTSSAAMADGAFVRTAKRDKRNQCQPPELVKKVGPNR